jgi:hypothetical protein
MLPVFVYSADYNNSTTVTTGNEERALIIMLVIIMYVMIMYYCLVWSLAWWHRDRLPFATNDRKIESAAV